MKTKILLTMSALVLMGCSVSQDMASTKDEIPKFHAALDAEKFDDIITNATADLNPATNDGTFRKILEAIHKKLGKFKSSTPVGWNDNATTGGHFVTIAVKSIYERGAADENFVFRLQDKSAKLAGYHINSAAMMIN